MLGRKRRLKNRSKALLYSHAVEAPRGLKRLAFFLLAGVLIGTDQRRVFGV
jgi:hypothetical protein